MVEKDMEALLWNYPERLLNEPLTQFRRQPRSSVGRADIIFTDRLGRFLVVEVKKGKLQRGAIDQLHDYFGMLKKEFPDKAVELMVVANHIPHERRVACEQYDIEWREITEKKFRDVAEEIGYVIESEIPSKEAPEHTTPIQPTRISESPRRGGKVERAWYYWKGADGKGYFLAFVNAKGSCSIRKFDAESGTFLGKPPNPPGDFQEVFRDYIVSGTEVLVGHQPNLEKHCKERLPCPVLAELRRQILRKSSEAST